MKGSLINLLNEVYLTENAFMVQVKNLMKKHVVTIGSETNVSTIARIMANNKIGSVVIVEKKCPVAIVTREDLVSLMAQDKDPKKTKVSSLKLKKLVTVKPTDDLLAAVRMMTKAGFKRAPVMDKGKLVGILADKEILLAAPELIEILSEKFKARVDKVTEGADAISGVCERCGDFSEDLRHAEGRWHCEDCRNDEGDEEEEGANI